MQPPLTDYELSNLYPHLTIEQRREMEIWHRGWLHKIMAGSATSEQYDSAIPPYPENPPVGFTTPEYDLIADISNEVEVRLGITLTDKERIDISYLNQRLLAEPEIDKFLNLEKEEENKEKFFRSKWNETMLDYFLNNERSESYKKFRFNHSMSRLILEMIYKNYLKQKR